MGEVRVEETVVTATDESVAITRRIRATRPHVANEEELERHRAFIEKLDAALWLEGAEA
jgi:DNA polymerase-3 subunit epsilon